jgi:hypothetical protein
MGLLDWIKGFFGGSSQQQDKGIVIHGAPLKLICSVEGLGDVEVPIVNVQGHPSKRSCKQVDTNSLSNGVGLLSFCYNQSNKVFYVFLQMKSSFKKLDVAEGYRSHLAFGRRKWDTQVNPSSRNISFKVNRVPYKEGYFSDCSVGVNDGSKMIHLNFSLRFERPELK